MHKRRLELAKYLYDEVSTKGYYFVIKESKVRSSRYNNVKVKIEKSRWTGLCVYSLALVFALFHLKP